MSTFKRQDLSEHELQELFSEAHKVVIAGIGNPLRKDDFVGVKIVRKLQGRVSSSVYLIECEAVPENFLDSILEFNPSHLLIIDAALLNLKPGSSKLLSSKHLKKQQAVSTHALPLRIFCDYLERATNAKIALLLIQPEDTTFGEGLTLEVQKTAERITRLLLRSLGT